ncbi:MAG: YqjF family protein [Opitutales bacterium]
MDAKEESADRDLDLYLLERAPPNAPIVMYQCWSELLFLHWIFDASTIQALLPPGLTVDTYRDHAYIGVVPFQMAGVRPRGFPCVPGLSNFPELNLRTYVRDAGGRPGVWFFSLDTPQPLANWIARSFFHLNYRRARFRLSQQGGRVLYRSQLKKLSGWDAEQHYEWERKGEIQTALPGSLEFFLAERYRLFAYDWKKSKLFTGRVHHAPYPLQNAELSAWSTRLFASNGLVVPADAPDHVMASGGVDVCVYPLRSIQP